MKYTNTRIVTFEGYPRLAESARELLIKANHFGGAIVLKGEEKRRYFVPRVVTYEDCTPLFSTPGYEEKRYTNLDELRKDFPSLQDSPILNNDFFLEVWNPKNSDFLFKPKNTPF